MPQYLINYLAEVVEAWMEIALDYAVWEAWTEEVKEIHIENGEVVYINF